MMTTIPGPTRARSERIERTSLDTTSQANRAAPRRSVAILSPRALTTRSNHVARIPAIPSNKYTVFDGRARQSSPRALGSAVGLTQVEHAFGLARAPLDRLGGHDGDVSGQPDHLVDLAPDDGAQPDERLAATVSDRGARLDLHLQRVERAVPAQHQEVVRFDVRHLEERALDLGRVHVDAANDEPVVRASGDPADARQGPSPRARLQW